MQKLGRIRSKSEQLNSLAPKLTRPIEVYLHAKRDGLLRRNKFGKLAIGMLCMLGVFSAGCSEVISACGQTLPRSSLVSESRIGIISLSDSPKPASSFSALEVTSKLLKHDSSFLVAVYLIPACAKDKESVSDDHLLGTFSFFRKPPPDELSTFVLPIGDRNIFDIPASDTAVVFKILPAKMEASVQGVEIEIVKVALLSSM